MRIGTLRLINFVNGRFCLVLSNVLDVSNNVEKTGLLLFTYYDAVCSSESKHISAACCSLGLLKADAK